jgi:hypothetical protein
MDIFRCAGRLGMLNAREAVQSIADFTGKWDRLAPGTMGDYLFRKVRDRVKACNYGVALCPQSAGCHKSDFILRFPLALVQAFPIEIGIIHNRLVLQCLSCLAMGYHLHESVLEPPCDGIARPELLPQFQRRDLIF